jgi:hypothetical protein
MKYVIEMGLGGMICQFHNDQFRKSSNIKVITSTI